MRLEDTCGRGTGDCTLPSWVKNEEMHDAKCGSVTLLLLGWEKPP